MVEHPKSKSTQPRFATATLYRQNTIRSLCRPDSACKMSALILEVSCHFRIKKKIEADINELEMALDHANKANAEAAKQIKRHAATLLDVDTACEEENRARLDIEDQVGMADRKGRKCSTHRLFESAR